MPELEEKFETHDIYLAAYLKLAGCHMQNRRKQGARVFFVFTNPGGSLKQLREDYYSGKALVKASEYAKNVMDMKQLCFDP
jgi:hypothetical protein